MPERYRLHRLLGAGGFGALYLATDSRVQRDVAIKVLTRATVNDRDVLRREARALAAVAHANIVNVLDVWELANADALVLEYVSRGSIGSVLHTGLVPPQDREVAGALAAVQRTGLRHCDLKPDNVLIDAMGHARLTDFGLARWSNDADATSAGLLGYAAPHVMLGEAPSAASDGYSLGVIAFELLTGQRAFAAAPTMEVVRRRTLDPLSSLEHFAFDLPGEVRDVLSRCLSAALEDRPDSAQQVHDILARSTSDDWAQRALDGLGITGPARPTDRAPRRTSAP